MNTTTAYNLVWTEDTGSEFAQCDMPFENLTDALAEQKELLTAGNEDAAIWVRDEAGEWAKHN